MKNNPMVNSLSELLVNIEQDVRNEHLGLYITDKNNQKSLFEKLLVQELVRDVDEKKTSFLAIRDIVLKESLRKNGLLTVFLDELEKLNVNIMFHDVVNNRLLAFLEKRGYLHLLEVKSEHQVISLYKLRSSNENKSSASV